MTTQTQADPRSALAPYLNQRVWAVGFYDQSNVFVRYGHRNKVVLVQDIEVATDHGQSVYVGHAWVQRANALYDAQFQRGDRVGFYARVVLYAGGTKYGLANPSQVETVASDYQEPCDSLELLGKIQGLVSRVDVPRLLPHLDELFQVSDLCGGPERFRQLLAGVQGLSGKPAA